MKFIRNGRKPPLNAFGVDILQINIFKCVSIFKAFFNCMILDKAANWIKLEYYFLL